MEWESVPYVVLNLHYQVESNLSSSKGKTACDIPPANSSTWRELEEASTLYMLFSFADKLTIDHWQEQWKTEFPKQLAFFTTWQGWQGLKGAEGMCILSIVIIVGASRMALRGFKAHCMLQMESGLIYISDRKWPSIVQPSGVWNQYPYPSSDQPAVKIPSAVPNASSFIPARIIVAATA